MLFQAITHLCNMNHPAIYLFNQINNASNKHCTVAYLTSLTISYHLFPLKLSWFYLHNSSIYYSVHTKLCNVIKSDHHIMIIFYWYNDNNHHHHRHLLQQTTFANCHHNIIILSHWHTKVVALQATVDRDTTYRPVKRHVCSGHDKPTRVNTQTNKINISPYQK